LSPTTGVNIYGRQLWLRVSIGYQRPLSAVFSEHRLFLALAASSRVVPPCSHGRVEDGDVLVMLEKLKETVL
jgi:hypothetical protein